MKRRTFILVGATLLTGGAILRLSGRQHGRDRLILKRSQALGEKNGILIAFGAPSTFYVAPYSVKDAQIPHGMATAADPTKVGPALDGIEESLRVYPDGFFSRLCGAIFLCGSLTLDGAPAGGTYGPAWIILSAPTELGDRGVFETARLGVHHEFSSLVWHHTPDLILEWHRFMPPGYKPSANNAEALRAASAGAPDVATGFLTAYGATDPENDFNVYAEIAFTNPEQLSRAAAAHPIVARKLALFMNGFTILDNRMTAVFDRLGLGGFRAAGPGALRQGFAFPSIQTPSPVVSFPGR